MFKINGRVKLLAKPLAKNAGHFLNAMQKISPEIFLPLPKNQKKRRFHSVMTSVTMFTQSQNPSNFIRI